MMNLIDHIKIYDDTLPDDTVSNFLEFMKKRNFQEAGVVSNDRGGNVYDKEARDCHAASLDRFDKKSLAMVHWANFFSEYFKKMILQYQNDLKLSALVLKEIIDITVLKYIEKGHFHPHSDHCAEIPRTISCILLLNDGYEGGDLVFYRPDIETKLLNVKARKNRLIIWPSNHLYPHQVEPVTAGERFSMVCWAL